MKRKILCAVLFASAALSASAQLEVGGSVGYSHNSLSTSSGYHYDRHYSPQGGVAAEVLVRYHFKEWFAVQSGIGYTEKNYEWHRSQGIPNMLGSPYWQAYRNAYVQLPMMASFSFGGRRVRGFLNLGGYVGYWADSHTTGVMPISPSYYFDEKIPFDDRRDNRFEAGLLAGAGVSYQINGLVRVFLEARYQHSFTDTQKEYMIEQTPRYHNTLTAQAGVSFRIGK